MKTYKIKKEYLFKTVTIKSKSTAITYNLWNLNQRTAEYLFTHGYQHMFEEEQLPEEAISLSSGETLQLPKEPIEVPEEKEFDLFVDKKKPCKTCGSQKTKRKYTKKI
jgi:hypothetical protein